MSFLRQLPSSPRSNLLTHGCRMFSTTRTCPLAKISLVGRLAATPARIPTSTGLDLIKYGIATNDRLGDVVRTSWWSISHKIKDDSKLTEYLLSLPKGTLVYVEGNCHMANYENKDGVKVHTINITQRSIEVLQRKRDHAEESEDNQGEETEHDQIEDPRSARGRE